MAMMYPKKVEKFGNDSEKQAYEILSSLPETYKVIYEPIIGTSKRYTPDFILLSELNGLVVLDVKYVNLENIERSDSRTIYYKDGRRLKNFNETVRDYTYVVINQLARTLQNNGAIVVNKKVNFSYSFGILLFVKDYENYAKNDIAKILSLDENSFIVCNDKESAKRDIEQFISNLNKPFTKGITNINHQDILNEIYINCDSDEKDLTGKLAKYNIFLNNIKEIPSNKNIFEKSSILKNNLLLFSEYSCKSLELMNKNTSQGLDKLIDELKKQKSEIEDEKFQIGVFGYFGSGKSTFLNALLGIDYLPTAEERLTAIFTKIAHTSEEYDVKNGDVKVYFKGFDEIENLYNESILNLKDILTIEEHQNFYNKFCEIEKIKNNLKTKLDNIKIKDYAGDLREQIKNSKIILNAILNFNQSSFGSIKNISISELKDYVADNENAIFLNEVKIYLDNDLLKNIELVDTPGYGSTNSLDTYKSHQFVQKANVVIFLTRATSPLQAMEEKKFLEEYISLYKDNENIVNANNLFIVANQIDTTQKSVDEVKNMIIKAVDDEFEGDFVVDKNNIFTLSSKYHSDIIKEGYSFEEPKNVNKEDLNIFKENFLKFLIKNQDKEFISKNFTEIDKNLTKVKDDFNFQKKKLTEDIDIINNRIKKFEENRSHIDKKLEMFINSIKSIESKLQTDVKNNLNSLSITTTDSNIKDSAIKNIANDFKKLYKNSPDDYSAYEYFSKYINLANHEAFVKINKKYEELIKDELEVVNVELDKYIKELELEYEIRGLETSFETKGINHNEIRDIDLKKSFLRDIWEFIKRPFSDDRWESYSESMVDSWNNNPNVYLKLKDHLDENINLKFINLDKEFTKTKDNLLENVKNKLESEKKSREAKQSDINSFDMKIKKFEEVLEKIDSYKKKLENQIKDLYKGE